MIKNRKWLITAVVVILGMTACQNDEKVNTLPTDSQKKASLPEGMMKLGKQLKNAYSVENMEVALATMLEEKPSARTSMAIVDVRTTHLYLRFHPKDYEELSVLEDDSTLTNFDYPLDYEIAQNGDYYHDPEIPADKPTYQYCAIPVDQKINNHVSYEVLRELYIPEEDEELGNEAARDSENWFADELVDKSLALTGNLEDDYDANSSASRTLRSRWTAEGTIKFRDDFTNIDGGIAGIKVECTRNFRTIEGYTDASGYFRCSGPRFKNSGRYRMVFEKQHFKILSDDRWVAEIKGPKRRYRWDDTITGGRGQFTGDIFRAAQHYYYGDIDGLRRPPLNSLGNQKMRIGAKYEPRGDADGRHNPARRWFITGAAWIKIYNPIGDSRRTYATTIHELAHASHWQMNKGIWFDDNFDSKVKESWARGVEWVLTERPIQII